MRKKLASQKLKTFSRQLPEHLYRKFTKEFDEWKADQELRSGWVCVHCGESTFETDYDYLISRTEHLGCVLDLSNATENRITSKEEIKGGSSPHWDRWNS